MPATAALPRQSAALTVASQDQTATDTTLQTQPVSGDYAGEGIVELGFKVFQLVLWRCLTPCNFPPFLVFFFVTLPLTYFSLLTIATQRKVFLLLDFRKSPLRFISQITLPLSHYVPVRKKGGVIASLHFPHAFVSFKTRNRKGRKGGGFRKKGLRKKQRISSRKGLNCPFPSYLCSHRFPLSFSRSASNAKKRV